MAVPDFQTLMRPLLVALSDGEERSVGELRQRLAEEFALTEADLTEELPSGRARTWVNRVGWSTTYLYRCGLIQRTRRSVYRITQRGRDVLAAEPRRVDLGVLSQFPEFHEFRRPRNDVARAAEPVAVAEAEATPAERLAAAHRELRIALAGDVRDRILDQSPEFFEPEIQRFVGALHGQRAGKGVFITTSTFSGEARAYAEGVVPRVVLVDGAELAQLMIEHDVGVTTVQRYELKRIDADYFAPEGEGP